MSKVGKYSGSELLHKAQQMDQQAKNLSLDRARAVRQSFLDYCAKNKFTIDESQFVAVGLGITKTVRWGKVPIKLRFEPQYSIIKPDSAGTAWNFRFQIAPVIPNPFDR